MLRAFRVEGVSPEADLGRDEEPEGVARVVDEVIHQDTRAREVNVGGTEGRVRLKDRDVQHVGRHCLPSLKLSRCRVHIGPDFFHRGSCQGSNPESRVPKC